ncbi:MAG: hypothetical protein ACN4GM_02840 [Gammaproteobacteria bacterium]
MTIKIQFLLRVMASALLIMGLIACSVQINPSTFEIQRLIVVNETPRALEDVKIYVGKTREFVTCGYILPNSECSIGFPLRKYQANRFDVSWLENGQATSVKDILVSEAENLMAGQAVNAVITFGRHGKFSARLQH